MTRPDVAAPADQCGSDPRDGCERSCHVTLVQTQKKFLGRGFHRKAVGVNHLAFPAATRADVDELFVWLTERGVPVLYGGPLDMGDDDSPNYAVFFEDPDRVKLEFVFMPRH